MPGRVPPLLKQPGLYSKTVTTDRFVCGTRPNTSPSLSSTWPFRATDWRCPQGSWSGGRWECFGFVLIGTLFFTASTADCKLTFHYSCLLDSRLSVVFLRRPCVMTSVEKKLRTSCQNYWSFTTWRPNACKEQGLQGASSLYLLEENTTDTTEGITLNIGYNVKYLWYILSPLPERHIYWKHHISASSDVNVILL